MTSSVPQNSKERLLIIALGLGLLIAPAFGAFKYFSYEPSQPTTGRQRMTIGDARQSHLLLGVAVILPLVLVAMCGGGFLLRIALGQVATESDLRSDPDAPKFADSSLVCFSSGFGSSIAVIADHDKGMIHFKKCFQRSQRGFFSGLAAPWWSCPLSDITGLSQITYKGHSTFIIETPQGKASISTRINNYAELRHYLQNRPLEQTQHAASSKAKVELSEKLHNSVSLPVQSEYVPEQVTIVARKPDAHRAPRPMPVKKEYAFGDKPLDWRVGMCVAGLFFGPIAGFLLGMTYDSKNVGMHSALGIVLGGCSGLPFFYVPPRRLGRLVVSKNGMPVAGGAVGLLVFLLLKFFFHLEFIDLLVLVGAGTVLGFLFASQRAK